MTKLYFCACGENKSNFGDLLTPYFHKHFTGEKNFVLSGPTKDTTDPVIMLVGSIIRDSLGGCIVCGCGVLNRKDIIKDAAKIFMVRGPITKKIVNECGLEQMGVMGDPALVLPLIYSPPIKKQHKIGLIPHYLEYHAVKSKYEGKIKIIDIDTGDINLTIDNINKCEYIVSSSLHGLIVAHAYNIPACWVKFTQLMPKDEIKFIDYYESLSIKNIDKSIDVSDHSLSENDFINLVKDSIQPKFPIKKDPIYEAMEISFLYEKNLQMIQRNFDKVARDIEKLLESNEAVMIGRFGGNETNFVKKYINKNREINLDCEWLKNLKKYAGYFDKRNDKSNLVKFCEIYLESYKNCDYVFIGNSELGSYYNLLSRDNSYYLKNKFPKIDKLFYSCFNGINAADYHFFESFLYIHKWLPLLNKKKILLISPFIKSIKSQIPKLPYIFKENCALYEDFSYPIFEKIEYIETPITYNDSSISSNIKENDFFEILEKIESQINEKDFDIALLGCGAYGIPLCSYIKKKGKKSIYLGGILQLLFGIKGSRWDTPYFQQFMTKEWIYPIEKNDIIEILKSDPNYAKTEGAKAYF